MNKNRLHNLLKKKDKVGETDVSVIVVIRVTEDLFWSSRENLSLTAMKTFNFFFGFYLNSRSLKFSVKFVEIFPQTKIFFLKK